MQGASRNGARFFLTITAHSPAAVHVPKKFPPLLRRSDWSSARPSRNTERLRRARSPLVPRAQ